MELFGLKDGNGKEYVLVSDDGITFSTHVSIKPIEPTPKFKVGDWVIRKKGGIPERIKYVDEYAFLCEDEVSGNLFENADGYCAYRLATASEIKSHLIKEAGRRGFKDNIKYRDPIDKEIYNLHLYSLEYWVERNMLADGCGGAIYEDGKWATIVPGKRPLPKTKEDLMKFLGNYCNRHCKSVEEFLEDYED